MDPTLNNTAAELRLSPEPRWKSVLACSLLVLLIAVVFTRVSHHRWLDYDDKYHVVDNAHFRSITPETYAFFWRHQFGNLYIPISYNFFAAEVWLTEHATGQTDVAAVSPVLFQAVKPVLQVAAALLVFGIVRRLRVGVWPAALGAAIFAVHPLQAESVAWISETRGLLATAFSLGAIWLYLRSLAARERARAGWYLLATACFALALLSKPSAVVVPVIAGMLDVFLRARPRRAIVAMTPWLAMSAAIMVITHALQPGSGVLHPAPIWVRPLIAGDALAFYLGKLVWPVNMTPDYARTPDDVLASSWIYVAWLIPAALTVLVGWAATKSRTGRAFLLSLGVLVVSLAPVLGLVTFDHQNISTVADRYMAFAMLGPAIAAAFAVPRLDFAEPSGRAAMAAGLLLVAALAWRTSDQVKLWRDDLTLWTHAVRLQPQSFTSRHNLGFALAQAGKPALAAEEYRLALKARPDWPLTLTNLAWTEMRLGHLSDAEALFNKSVSLAPNDARTSLGQGILFARTGRLAEAVKSFRRSVELRPDDAETRANLGLALDKTGDPAGAMEQYQTAIRLRPSCALAWNNLGELYRELDQPEKAIDAWTQAVELDPALATSSLWFHLGDACARLGRLDNAATAYQQCLNANPNNADAANNLGLVYIRLKKIDDAIAMFEQAVNSRANFAEAQENLANARILKQRQEKLAPNNPD